MVASYEQNVHDENPLRKVNWLRLDIPLGEIWRNAETNMLVMRFVSNKVASRKVACVYMCTDVRIVE